jgi:rhodanese domain protein
MNYLMTLLASAIGSCALGTLDGEVPVLTPEVFIETARADSTAFILDVRRPGEFAEGHLEGAQLLDWLDQPAFIEGIKHFDKKRTYYLYCRSGKRSNAAATYMQAEGFRVRDMEGGYMRWTAEGRPVVK